MKFILLKFFPHLVSDVCYFILLFHLFHKQNRLLKSLFSLHFVITYFFPVCSSGFRTLNLISDSHVKFVLILLKTFCLFASEMVKKKSCKSFFIVIRS